MSVSVHSFQSALTLLGFDAKMHLITRSCVLFLWIQTLVLVQSQDCTLQDFISGPLFDSNFDTTSLDAAYAGGRQVRVSCNVGYSGFFKLICVEGKWQSRGTKCQAKSCGHPGDAQFADFQLHKGQDFVFGSEVLYTCHKGYQMVSRSNVRRCMAEGWDGVVPVCEAQQCPVINVDDNVVVYGDPQDSNYGNVLRFNCKFNDQVLDGEQEIYCDENAKWSADPPTCKEIRCSAHMIANGTIAGEVRDYREGEVLHFACNRGFKKQSGIPSKCSKRTNSAEFTPAPVCVESSCTLPLSLSQGASYDPPDKNVFRPNQTVTVNCDRKHYIITPQTTSHKCTCDEDGNWDITPECQEVRCRDERIPNVVSFGPPRRWGETRIFRMEDTAEYRCQRGFRETANRATCTRDGWAPDPLCRGTPCEKREVLNAKITINDKQTYSYNEWVRYVCEEGYTGQFTLTCKGYYWDGTPRCTEAGCAEIGIRGARITYNDKRRYSPGDVVYYTCENDPQQQQLRVTCRKGNWEGIQNCEGCPKLKIPNGFVVARGDEKVYYTCSEGYKLPSKGWWNEAKCVNRKWKGHQECIEKSQCGQLPVIPHGKLTRRGTRTRPTAQIDCEEGYSTQAQTPTCQNGAWDFGGLSPETLCTVISTPCSPPPRVMFAVITTPYQGTYLSGSELTYRCADGYTMDGGDRIRCLNGQWEQTRNITCTAPSAPAAPDDRDPQEPVEIHRNH